MKYKLTNIYFTDADKYFYELTNDHLDYLLMKNKLNRSEIGKKAYKTFLKNGGSRNSKGQFSNKEKYKIFSNFTIGDKTYYFKPMRGTSIELFDNQIFIKQTDGSYSAITIEKPTEKQQVDWEKLGDEAYGGSAVVAKVFAKVFKKHGLLKDGVEI